jgi:DNA mismatch repair protein MSH6
VVLPKRKSSDGKEILGPFAPSFLGSDCFNRELNKVYTNGTLVDPEFLKDEQAGHCVCVFEEPGVDDGSDKNKNKGRIMAKGEDKGHRFGVCVLDCATSQFNLSPFEDDVSNKTGDVDEANSSEGGAFQEGFLNFSCSSRGVSSDYF